MHDKSSSHGAAGREATEVVGRLADSHVNMRLDAELLSRWVAGCLACGPHQGRAGAAWQACVYTMHVSTCMVDLGLFSRSLPTAGCLLLPPPLPLVCLLLPTAPLPA